MKFENTRIALLSAFALTNPLFVLAGAQSDNSQTPADQTQYQSAQPQDSDSTPQAVQQGKDTGNTRSDVFLRTEAPPIEIPAEPPCVQYGKHTCPNWNDPAFHK
jgi:hypothetical protein